METTLIYDDIRQLYEKNLRDKAEIEAVNSGRLEPRIPDGKKWCQHNYFVV